MDHNKYNLRVHRNISEKMRQKDFIYDDIKIKSCGSSSKKVNKKNLFLLFSSSWIIFQWKKKKEIKGNKIQTIIHQVLGKQQSRAQQFQIPDNSICQLSDYELLSKKHEEESHDKINKNFINLLFKKLCYSNLMSHEYWSSSVTIVHCPLQRLRLCQLMWNHISTSTAKLATG